MQRRVACSAAALTLCAALASACGSKNSLASILSPTDGVTVTGLAISFNTPPVGGTMQATATATFSNGSTTPVASGFGSDTPAVATVTAAGAVTGIAIGDVTIFVNYQGLRASKLVHVLPGYAGTFSGTYMVSGCTETEGFASDDPDQDFCTGATGLVGAIAIQSTQSGDLTTLTGLFQLGGGTNGVVGSGSGTVSASGTLSYSGSVVIQSTTRLDLRNWTATSPAPGRITGSFEMLFTDSTIAGQGVLTCSNMDMTRQSLTASMAAAPQSVGPLDRAHRAATILRALRIHR